VKGGSSSNKLTVVITSLQQGTVLRTHYDDREPVCSLGLFTVVQTPEGTAVFYIYGCCKSAASCGVSEDASIELYSPGLDPAQPCFQADSPDVRLDLDDAEFIDVIHTNGRGLVKVGLGLPQPIGELFSQILGNIKTEK
jgi:hypothetical protein